MKPLIARLGVTILGLAAVLAVGTLLGGTLLGGAPVGGAAAQSSLAGQEKKIVPMIKANWIAFRNFNGKQLIYFTLLQSYRCGLKEIRYSLNSDALDLRFPLGPCDPQRPNAIDTEKFPPYITLPLGAAKSAHVQVIFTDGEASEIIRYTVCDNPGDSSCVVMRP
ncbi:MAG: hypothetical protein ACTSY1_03310 [Alphaproteobacteria bacterium]